MRKNLNKRKKNFPCIQETIYYDYVSKKNTNKNSGLLTAENK